MKYFFAWSSQPFLFLKIDDNRFLDYQILCRYGHDLTTRQCELSVTSRNVPLNCDLWMLLSEAVPTVNNITYSSSIMMISQYANGWYKLLARPFSLVTRNWWLAIWLWMKIIALFMLVNSCSRLFPVDTELNILNYFPYSKVSSYIATKTCPGNQGASKWEVRTRPFWLQELVKNWVLALLHRLICTAIVWYTVTSINIVPRYIRLFILYKTKYDYP